MSKKFYFTGVTLLILLTALFLLITGVSYAAVKPEVFLNTDKLTITSGDSIKLSWSVRNTPNRCWGSENENWNGDKTIPANNAWTSETLTPSGTGTKRFSFTCSNSAGNSNTASVNVVVNPKVVQVSIPEVFLNTDKLTITSGDSIKLSWSVRNTPNRCWGSENENWNGDKTIPANNAWTSETLTPSGTGTKRFSFTCSNSAGNSNTASVNVVVNPKVVEPTPGVPVPLNVPGSDGPITKIAGQSITLNWGVANVTSWSIMSDTDHGFSRSGGAVGAVPQYNSATFTPLAPPSGTSSVSHIYKIIGVGSEVKDSVLVIVRNEQCCDGLDNDSDGKIDDNDNDEGDEVLSPFCGDGSCDGSENSSSCPADCGVGSQPQCNDGKDNDSDGKTDMDDPGCSSQDDDDETDPLPPVINDFWAENSDGFSSCTIDASPKLLVMPKNTSKLTWSCDRIIVGCTLNDNNPKIPDTGAVDSSGSLNTPPINATTTFTLKCPGVGNIPPVTIRLFSPFLKEIIPQ